VRFSPIHKHALLSLLAVGLAVGGCAAIAGLDEDYVGGAVGGSDATGAATTTSATGATGGAAVAGAGGAAAGGTGIGGAGAAAAAGGGGSAGGAGGSAPLRYADVVLEDAPVAYWRFGEPGGPTAFDSSGLGHDAQYHGNVGYGHAGAIAGDANTAIHFTGDGADVSHQLAFDDFVNREPFSLECWFQCDHYDGVYRHLFNKDFTGLNYRHNIGLFVTTAENGTGFERFVTGDKHQALAPLPEIGVWTHLVGTYDGSNMRLYIDGALVDTEPDERNQDPKPVATFVGAKFALGQVWAGGLDEFAIYDHELAASRVALHHQVGRGD
jgi:hypothetical protein